MQLLVERGPDDGIAITGKMSVDGKFECYTLEPSASARYPCVPEGTYPVVLLLSPRFNEITPHIQNVPERSFIEIHPGNKAKDTLGCVLVGETESLDWVGSSRAAFTRLMALLEPNAEGLTITFENPTSSISATANDGDGGNNAD